MKQNGFWIRFLKKLFFKNSCQNLFIVEHLIHRWQNFLHHSKPSPRNKIIRSCNKFIDLMIKFIFNFHVIRLCISYLWIVICLKSLNKTMCMFGKNRKYFVVFINEYQCKQKLNRVKINVCNWLI